MRLLRHVRRRRRGADGFVFVALSLHLDRVVANPFHRFRARISVAGLTSMVILAGAALVPTQSHQAFGLEVLANAAFFLWFNVTTVRPSLSRFRYGFSPASPGPRPPSGQGRRA